MISLLFAFYCSTTLASPTDENLNQWVPLNGTLYHLLSERLNVKGFNAKEVYQTYIPGLIAFKHNQQYIYTDHNANYFILGDIIDINQSGGFDIIDKQTLVNNKINMEQNPSHKNQRSNIKVKNIQEEKGEQTIESEKVVYQIGVDHQGNPLNKEQLKKQIQTAVKSITRDITINFLADNEKMELVVFTDPDCPYCKKFHRSIKELNKFGVTVRYVMHPRKMVAGIKSSQNSQFVKDYVTVMCSKNQSEMTHKWYSGQVLGEPQCSSEDLKKYEKVLLSNYVLSKIFNVKGTPYIFSNKGHFIKGFKNLTKLAKQLK